MTNYITAAGVQQFTITIASGSTTGTTTTGTAVGSGAYITYGGINPSVTTDFAEAGAYLSWATASGTTTITATRNTNTTGTVVITGSITDGDTTNLIKTVQQGTVSISANTSGTAAVTAPSSDTNTAIHYLGNKGTGTTLAADTDFTRLSQSGNTVTANVPTSGTTVTGFCLIEFQSSCLTAHAVQRISASSSSSVTSFTASPTSVVLANAITFYGGSTIASVTTNIAEAMMRGAMSGVGTFTVSVNTGVADAKVFNASLVEFNSGVLNSSVQRGTTTLTGVTSNTTTLTAVNEAYAGMMWLGNTTTVITAALNEAMGAGLSSNTNSAATFTIGSCTYCSSGAQFANNGSTPTLLHISNEGSSTITSTTAGSLLIVTIDDPSEGDTGITAITDNKGQSWSHATNTKGTVTGVCATDIWYFANTVSGVTSLTLTQTGSFNPRQIVYEISNGATSAPLITSNNISNAASSGSACVSPSFAITNGSIIVQCVSNSINTQASVALPYTIDGLENDSAYYVNAQDTYTITVTKNNATSNITGSWEVFEFPAYSGGGSITYGVAAAGGTQATSGTIGWAG